MEMLNELYFGKTPEILEIREKFEKVYNFVKENDDTPPYREAAYMDLCKSIEKMWGINKFRLVIDGRDIINGYTHPVQLSKKEHLANDDIFIVTPKSITFNPKYKFNTYMCIYRGEFNHCSPDEVFATLLHEIGHSFAGVMYGVKIKNTAEIKVKINNVVTNIVRQCYAKSIDGVNEFIDDVIKEDGLYTSIVDQYKKETSQKYKGVGVITNVVYGILSALTLPFSLLNTLITLPNKIMDFIKLKKTGKSVGTLDGYGLEFFSDSFAAMYGYGVNSVSSLAMSDNMVGNRFSTQMFSLHWLLSSFSPSTHPTTYARALSVIAHYEFEIRNNKDLEPGDKKDLEKYIVELRVLIENEMENNVKLSKLPIGVKIYRHILKKVFKDVLNKDFNEADYDYGMKK